MNPPSKNDDTTITRAVRRKTETAARLTAARMAKGWSRPDLAHYSGRSISELNKFEQGNRPVTLEAAIEFQRVFDLPAAWFMDMISPAALGHTCLTDGFKGNPGEVFSSQHILKQVSVSSDTDESVG